MRRETPPLFLEAVIIIIIIFAVIGLIYADINNKISAESTEPIHEIEDSITDISKFAVDGDGGAWVIVALPVPDEWKERRTMEEE